MNIMVDLETLGQTPGCVILSIGAIAFDASGPYREGLYTVANTEDCMGHFLFKEPATESWWADQTPEARDVLLKASNPDTSVPLKLALQQLNDFIASFGAPDKVRVWGNGSDFDNAILAAAYQATKMKPGWKFWNNRCYRTLKNLVPGVVMQRTGTHHNALDDAKSQAAHAAEIMRSLATAGLTF